MMKLKEFPMRVDKTMMILFNPSLVKYLRTKLGFK